MFLQLPAQLEMVPKEDTTMDELHQEAPVPGAAVESCEVAQKTAEGENPLVCDESLQIGEEATLVVAEVSQVDASSSSATSNEHEKDMSLLIPKDVMPQPTHRHFTKGPVLVRPMTTSPLVPAEEPIDMGSESEGGNPPIVCPLQQLKLQDPCFG